MEILEEQLWGRQRPNAGLIYLKIKVHRLQLKVRKYVRRRYDKRTGN